MTELTNSGKNQAAKLLEIESSKIVVKDKESDFEASVQSSYQALESLKRRGLALDFAGIMPFTKHDRYVHMLFSHLNRDPPVGYNRCSVSQLIAADKAAWSLLIEQNVKPRPDLAGNFALDTKLEESLKSYEVSFTLLPLASKTQTKPDVKPQPATPKAAPTHAKGGKKGNNRFKPYSMKGKGKTKSDQRIPKEICDAGGTATTPDGSPICFDYSLKRCKEAVSEGSRCKKGYHLCGICYGPHCLLDHKKA